MENGEMNMNEKLGEFVTGNPLPTIIVILMITIAMFFVSSSPETFGLEKYETEDEYAWLPDNEMVDALEEVGDDYGVQAVYMQIIVQGNDGNVLTKSALLDILTVEKKIAGDPTVQFALFPLPGNISSLASTVAMMILGDWTAGYDEMSQALQNVDQATIDGVLRNAADFLGVFLSRDFRENLGPDGLGALQAKASLMMVKMDSDRYDEIDLDEDYNPILDADNAVADIIDDTEFTGVRRMGIIEGLYTTQQIEEESGDAMEQIFMLVFILIIVILVLMYRSVFDTVIGLLGLVFALMWMNGIGVLLGLTFGSMYQAVPIIIVGLGVDYALHLVMRYREGRVEDGKNISNALILSIVTVGASLFLATLTTAISFSSNLSSEMTPMREFGTFAAVGIISCFIIMVTWVPACKMLYHSRQEGHGKRESKKPKSVGEQSAASPGKTETGESETLLTRIFMKGAVAAERNPYHIIAAVIVISLISTGLAMNLTTEFDYTDFLPDDTQVKNDIAYLGDNFDFGTEEVTVLVKGNMTDPDVLKSMNDTEENILDDPDVNEQEPINSILTLMRTVARGNDEILANETFAAMYNDSDTNGDDVPDRNIEALYDFLITNGTLYHKVIGVLHYNGDTGEYDGAVIRIGVNSDFGKKAEDISDHIEDDIEPLETEDKADATPTGGPVLGHMIVSSIENSGI